MTATKHRWLEQGWTSYTEAHLAFRRILEDAIKAGMKPGERFPAFYEEFLTWLVQGHPHAEKYLAIFVNHDGYYTFVENGREGMAGYSFAVTDGKRRTKPFSVADALTGKEHYQFFDKDNPFAGMRS